MSSIPSIIKWTGSKRKQSSTIFNIIPNHSRYIEPFLGGGSVLFLAKEKSTESPICSDIYEPLIELWCLIKDDPEQLINNYAMQWDKLSDELDILYADDSNNKRLKNIPKTYYDIRDSFNNSPNALDLNFVLRTCVNGIVRFNSKGEFNNSFHLSRRGMNPKTFERNVMIWHKKIQNVSFLSQDYEVTLGLAKKGDLVYLDPPYANSKNRYINNLDLERLLLNLERLNKKGVLWALSFDGNRDNSDYTHEMPPELYRNRFSIENGISNIRNLLANEQEYVTESLYTNF